MPGLTISTDTRKTKQPLSAAGAASSSSRSSSPNRPPVSPITPPLLPAQLASQAPQQQQQQGLRNGGEGGGRLGAEAGAGAGARVNYSHSTQQPQTAQTAIQPPPPEPIDFDSNPDVIAVKSAISILQMQRRRATGDVQALSGIKSAALAEPEAFLEDFRTGKVNIGAASGGGAGRLSEGLGLRRQASAPKKVNVGGEDDDEDDNDDDDKMDEDNEKDEVGDEAKTRIWNTLPTAQQVVRCPPINWSQYAVVGESLDKLHAEQISHPPQGQPAVYTRSGGDGGVTAAAAGVYEFKGQDNSHNNNNNNATAVGAEPYRGVAAPYAPTRDKIDSKRGKHNKK